MTGRPYVVLSCAVSLDGCLDGTGAERLVLSGAADLDRVDAERAAADAILVGAGTVRRDDPRLLIRSADRRAERRARGRPDHPAGVTITASGDLQPGGPLLHPRGGEEGAGMWVWGGVRGRGPGEAVRGTVGERRRASSTPPRPQRRSWMASSAGWPRSSTPATRRG